MQRRKMVVTRFIFGIAFCGLLLLSGQPACSQQIPPLSDIPDNLNPEQKAKLIREKQALEKELKAFQDAAATFNAKPAEDQSDKEYEALQTRRSNYIGAVTSFNDQVDPSVVDARNVPSGLPKALEDAMVRAYTGAPAGVSGRVRKGLQAVMIHDWKVASAWFQDALQRNPGNLGLQRLVAFVRFALQEHGQTSNPHAENKGDEDLNRALDAFYRDYLPKHPELMNPQPTPTEADSVQKPVGVKAADMGKNLDWQQKMITLFTQPELKH